MIVLSEVFRGLPLVDVQIVLRTGAVLDPEDGAGLTRHAAELMSRGAAGRSRAEIDAGFDALGTSLHVSTTHDEVSFSARCLSRNFEAVVARIAEILTRPEFPVEEHEKLKRESLALLDDIRDEDSSLVSRNFERFCLAGHPYGRSVLGVESSIRGLSREAAQAWFHRSLFRANLVVGLAGDIDEKQAGEEMARLLADLPEGEAPRLPPLPMPELPPGRKTYLIDKPERSQTQVIVGHGAPPRSHPDWLPLHVASVIFGGSFTSPLVTEVRVKRGWSYSVGTRLTRARGGRHFRIRFHPAAEQTADCLALVFDLWQELRDVGATEEQLEFAKSYLVGNWAFEIDTAAHRLDKRLDTLVFELPDDEYATLPDRMRALTLDEVNAAMKRWWHPDRAVTVMVCTAADLEPTLASVPLGERRVIPYTDY